MTFWPRSWTICVHSTQAGIRVRKRALYQGARAELVHTVQAEGAFTRAREGKKEIAQGGLQAFRGLADTWDL